MTKRITQEEYEEVIAAWHTRGDQIMKLRGLLADVESFILANYGPPSSAEGIELMQKITIALREDI